MEGSSVCIPRSRSSCKRSIGSSGNLCAIGTTVFQDWITVSKQTQKPSTLENTQRCALIACADMSDVARKLSCERIPAASLRKEEEELNEDEIDGDNEEEEEENEEGM